MVLLFVVSIATIVLEIRNYHITVGAGLELLRSKLTKSLETQMIDRINNVVDFIDSERQAMTEIALRDAKMSANMAYKVLNGTYREIGSESEGSKVVSEFERRLMEKGILNVFLVSKDTYTVYNTPGIVRSGPVRFLIEKLRVSRAKELYYQDRDTGYVFFVRTFKPLNLYIAAWENLNIRMVKRDTLLFLRYFPYTKNEKSYIFVLKLNSLSGGDCFARVLLNPNFPNRVGKCISTKERGKRGFPFVRAGLERIREKGEALIRYYNKVPGTDKVVVKVAYMKLYRPYNWVVGTGFYMTQVDSFVNELKKTLYRRNRDFIINFIAPIFAMLMLLLGIYLFIMEKMKESEDIFYKEINNAIKNKSVLTEDLIERNVLFRTYEFHSIFNIINSVIENFRKTEMDIVESFISTLEARDVYTKGHSQRVAHYAKAIAKALGFSERDQSRIYIAGILHDIGKIGIPDHILLKPGLLTKHEYKIMKYHPLFSYYILKSLEPFKDIALMVKQHHERCSGNGYPDGLKCDEILKEARILAIADVFDAITSKRPYRKRLTVDEAIEILKKEDLDKEILPVAIETLRKAFVDEEKVHTSFAPEELEAIRKDIFNLDYLTGFPKRTSLEKVARDFVESQVPFVVCLIDIRHLMVINYEFSFSVGDEVIACTAEVLRGMTESQMGISWDAISRPFSDSFALIYKLKNVADLSTIDEMKKRALNYLRESVKALISRRHPDLISEKGKHVSEYIDYTITHASYPKDAKDLNHLILICEWRKYEARIGI